jgi:hypothetical protein
MIVIRRIVVAWLLLGIHSVQAAGDDSQQMLQAGLLYLQDQGLVANIPACDSPETLRHVQSFHSELASRQTQYATNVEETRFKTQDTLITIIMPGGLIYAMNKQQRHEQAKQAYARVSEQLEDLQVDLARLRASTSEASFALLD